MDKERCEYNPDLILLHRERMDLFLRECLLDVHSQDSAVCFSACEWDD